MRLATNMSGECSELVLALSANRKMAAGSVNIELANNIAGS